MSVHASISLGLDFSLWLAFKAEVRHNFGSTVHPLGKANHFLMVVPSGRAKFKLSKDLVSMALESCLGGLCNVMIYLLSSLVI
jgi:hypothetical protein